MKCKNCGFDNPENSKFCGKCQAELIDEKESENNQNKKQKKSRKKLIFICSSICAVCLVVFLVLLFTVFAKSNSDNQPQDSTTTHYEVVKEVANEETTKPIKATEASKKSESAETTESAKASEVTESSKAQERTEPTESQKSVSQNSEEWKGLYIDYVGTLNKDSYREGCLVYIDDDDVPELYIPGYYSMAGSLVCWIENGQVKTMQCSQTVGVRKRTGVFYSFIVRSNYSKVIEYKLSNGLVNSKEICSCNYDSGEYIWKGESVTEDEYNSNSGSYFSEYEFPSEYGYVSFDEFDRYFSVY